MLVGSTEDDEATCEFGCVECDAPLDGARPWRAYLTGEGTIHLYCHECAVREFGE